MQARFIKLEDFYLQYIRPLSIIFFSFNVLRD